MPNKKIMLLGPYPPPYGGVSVFVSVLNEFFSNSGYRYELKICRQQDIPADKVVLPTFMSVYKGFESSSRNDVCVDSSSYFLEYVEFRKRKAFIAWLWHKITKRFTWIKIIHDGTLPARYEQFEPIRKLLFRILVHFIDEFIVVNDDLSHWLRMRHRVSQRITVINSLLPIPDDEYAAALHSEHGAFLSKHSRWICAIGTFHPSYGFIHIADAVEKVRRESGVDIGLMLIDGGFAADITEENKMAVLKKRRWISVLTSISHSHVLQLLKKSDVFVRGVALESYGLSRVEALWCGTPVIATKTGETRGMLLYDFGNSEQLAHQMNRALFDPAVKKDIAMWAEQYRSEANANLDKLLRTITER